MAMRRSSCWGRLVAVGALVAASWTGGFANAGEGFYAGLAVGREHAGVDYRKSAGVDVASASHMEAGDDASAGVNALKLSGVSLGACRAVLFVRRARGGALRTKPGTISS